jgi:prophage regulatory protein
MSERIIRLPELIKLVGLSKPTIYKHIKTGKFPAQIKLNGPLSGWIESEVQAWINQMIAARHMAASSGKAA